MVVNNWSACSLPTLTIRVQMPLKPTVAAVKFVAEKKENNRKIGRGWPIKKLYMVYLDI